jgi:hypothetical protein
MLEVVSGGIIFVKVAQNACWVCLKLNIQFCSALRLKFHQFFDEITLKKATNY